MSSDEQKRTVLNRPEEFAPPTLPTAPTAPHKKKKKIVPQKVREAVELLARPRKSQ